MAKRYRVKRYYGRNESSYRAKPRLITIILVVLVFAGLGYLGTVIYKPAYDFIMNIGKAPVESSSGPESASSEPVSSSEPEKQPEPPKRPEYKKLKAVYIPHEVAADQNKLDEFLTGLSDTQINAVMIDIKNYEGEVLFKSKNEMAVKWGVVAAGAIDLKVFAAKLRDRGLSLVVKMSAFRDPKAASAGRLEYAISYQNSGFLWLDAAPEAGGRPWLNPYSGLTQEYLSSIALEAVGAGAEAVVLENVQFPDNSAVYASFGESAVAMSRSEILKTFVVDLTARAEEKNARVMVYFPVVEVTRQEGEDNRYGGSILKIPDEFLLLGAEPLQFGGAYNAGGLDIKDPLGDPADAVKAAVSYVKQGIPASTKIIPMLQGGNDADFNKTTVYTDVQVKAQIAAAAEAGLDEYVLYNDKGEYLLGQGQ